MKKGAFKTGIDFIDRNITAQIGSGDVVLLSTSFAIGKTTLACKIGAKLWVNGNNILYVTVEDHPKNIQNKFITNYTGIPITELKDRDTEVTEALMNRPAYHGTTTIKKFNHGGLAELEDLIIEGLENKIDVLIIDEMGAIPLNPTDRDNLLMEVKRIANEYGILIIGTVQKIRRVAQDSVDYEGSDFLIDVEKNLEQKKESLADVTLYNLDGQNSKQRFYNVQFNNSNLQIG